MRYVIAGASGFLGTALRDHLARAGHEVVRLVRGPAATPSESSWDPSSGRLDRSQVESADVVVNLAGASLGRVPWTPSYGEVVLRSRTDTTRTLAEAIATGDRKPVFLAQSGISGYGDHDDRTLTEDDPTDADTFLGRVTREWEAATLPAEQAGARVVHLRTAPVLGRGGGQLAPVLLAFRLGLGGRLGDGRQYFPTISLTDWVRAATFLAETPASGGAYNLAGPHPATNAEFTRALATRLHRPAVLRVPAWPLRLLLGPIGEEALASVRLRPQRLLDGGFTFTHPTVDEQVDAVLR